MSDAAESRVRLYLPGLAGLYRGLEPLGYALMRFVCGAVVIPHGFAKLFGGLAPIVAQHVLTPLGFPVPLALAYGLGLLEFLGGAMLALGLFTRPLALLFAIEFAVITFAWQLPHGYYFTAPGGGYEFPLLLLLLYVGILFRGSGACALDRLIGREF